MNSRDFRNIRKAKKLLKNSKKILKDEEEEIKDLKKDIRYILERIDELHEGRNYIKKELQSKSLDDMLPAEDIKSAIKAIDSVLRDLRLN